MQNKCNEKRPLVNEIVTDDSDSEETVEVYGGYWGWILVLASFLNLAMIDGVGYTTGILLDPLLADLGGG